jgi:hypothetical protein
MAANADSSSPSANAKPLKAGVDTTVTGGTSKIDFCDDSIHSHETLDD